MPVPFCKEQSFRFRHLRPARLNHPVVRAIDLSLDAKSAFAFSASSLGHSSAGQGESKRQAVLHSAFLAEEHSSLGQCSHSTLSCESLCHSNLGSQTFDRQDHSPFQPLAVILHDSAHTVVKLTPHSGELNSTIHRSEGGRHFHTGPCRTQRLHSSSCRPLMAPRCSTASNAFAHSGCHRIGCAGHLLLTNLCSRELAMWARTSERGFCTSLFDHARSCRSDYRVQIVQLSTDLQL